MTSIPIEMPIGRVGPGSPARVGLAVGRRRVARTVKQASVVVLVLGIGGALRIMKWTGLLVL